MNYEMELVVLGRPRIDDAFDTRFDRMNLLSAADRTIRKCSNSVGSGAASSIFKPRRTFNKHLFRRSRGKRLGRELFIR